ncbi:hypothetical protein ACHAWF_010369 [Thalassiosira exigua]
MKILPFACWSLTSILPAVSAVSIRGGGAVEGSVSTSDGGGSGHTNSSRFLIGERRLLAHEGVMRTLILRVTDGAGNAPITDARRESDTWFGTHGLILAENQNSMSGLYEQCSGGKLLFVPATGPGVVNGVLEFPMDQDMSGQHVSTAGGWVRDKFNGLSGELGIEFEAYSVILPVGVSGSGGLARQGGAHQYYAGGADRSLELVMHEFGHNLGLHHSGLPDEGDYDDNSCLMGCCAGAQQMCFNAAKSWYSGWYNDEGKQGYEDLDHFDTPGQWWKGKLVGVDDYLKHVFDETQHRVVVKVGSLFVLFNRKKGVNSGVKAYGDEVVIVQQWGEGGKSKVRAHLNEDHRVITFPKDLLYTDFDVVVELCEIFYAPIVTGPQITGAAATQSSTAAGAEASWAIDGNLDQTWAGGSVTHTSGDDEDLDPWWKLTFDQAQEIEHVRIYNRNDCCGSRLSNAILELQDEAGEIVYSHNLGAAEDVKDVYLGSVYRVREVIIKLLGYKVLSLAEVQVFGPSGQQERLPDFARVVAYASNGIQSISCATTLAPTTSMLPSASPTLTMQPTIYRAVPRDVVLLRDDSTCILQSNPDSHPDRIKCMLQPTVSKSGPGGYGNDDVALRGKDGCLVVVQPVSWSWGGTAFIFESSESLDTINECFDTKILISESMPTGSPSIAPSMEIIPNDVLLLRDGAPCIFQSNPSNHPDRFKCTIQPTTVNSEPGDYGNDPVGLRGTDGCLVIVRPVTWAWDGTAFIFESSESLASVNECFAPGELLAEGAPTAIPSIAPSVAIIPPGVALQRDGAPCVFQVNPANHPDRFKCTIEPTSPNAEPGGYGHDLVGLTGRENCVLFVRPVTWAWDGTAFVFESTANLDTINDCFDAGMLITASRETGTSFF